MNKVYIESFARFFSGLFPNIIESEKEFYSNLHAIFRHNPSKVKEIKGVNYDYQIKKLAHSLLNNNVMEEMFSDDITQKAFKMFGVVLYECEVHDNKFYVNAYINEPNEDDHLLEVYYVKTDDGQMYRYNYEIDDKCFCPNNIIIDNGKIITDYTDTSRYVFLDYLILDLQEKRIFQVTNGKTDGFIDSIPRIDRIDILDISINNSDNIKNILIKCGDKDIRITLDALGRITEYTNPCVLNIHDDFLKYNSSLTSLDLENVISVGNAFLVFNNALKKLNMPVVEAICDGFLVSNKSLEEGNFPNLKMVGNDFIHNDNSLKRLYAPKLEMVGSYFLTFSSIEDVELPCLIKAGSFFMSNNVTAQKIMLPKLKYAGYGFFKRNEFGTNLASYFDDEESKKNTYN